MSLPTLALALTKPVRVLVPDTTSEEALLKGLGVPGVRYDYKERALLGYFDAVASAAKSCGVKPEVLAQVERTTHADHAPKLVMPDARLLDIARKLGLREYQVVGVRAAANIVRASGGVLIADDMGLGKTRQGLALAYLLSPAYKTVIVCPASVRQQWLKECGLISTDASLVYIVEHGKPLDTRALNQVRDAAFVVTSYELCGHTLDLCRQTGSMPGVAIFDEMHRVKGRNRVTKKGEESYAESANQLAIHTPHKIGLTGTPLGDRPRDSWKLLNILWGSRFGRAYDFDIRYAGGVHDERNHFQNKGASNTEELQFRLSKYMVRRMKSEVLAELPALTRTFRWVEPDQLATAAFNRAVGSRKSGDVHKALMAALEGKLKQTAETCAEARQFLCLTWTRKHAEKLGEMIRNLGVNCEHFHGNYSPAQRQAIIANAIANKTGIVATLESIGEGVDGLQYVADTGIMHAFSYKARLLLQAEARLHRMGQANAVTWVYIGMRDTADERVLNTIVSKLDAYSSIIPDAGVTGMSNSFKDSMTADDPAAVQALFDALPEGGSDGGD